MATKKILIKKFQAAKNRGFKTKELKFEEKSNENEKAGQPPTNRDFMFSIIRLVFPASNDG